MKTTLETPKPTAAESPSPVIAAALAPLGVALAPSARRVTGYHMFWNPDANSGRFRIELDGGEIVQSELASAPEFEAVADLMRGATQG